MGTGNENGNFIYYNSVRGKNPCTVKRIYCKSKFLESRTVQVKRLVKVRTTNFDLGLPVFREIDGQKVYMGYNEVLLCLY